jgi:hypothetical protein
VWAIHHWLVLMQAGARQIDEDRPLKDQAIEAILIRWQYSGIAWAPGGSGPAFSGSGLPTAAGAGASAATAAPGGFMEMPGFSGVYAGVREDVLGTIRDNRPRAPRPSRVSGVGRIPCSVGWGNTEHIINIFLLFCFAGLPADPLQLRAQRHVEDCPGEPAQDSRGV